MKYASKTKYSIDLINSVDTSKPIHIDNGGDVRFTTKDNEFTWIHIDSYDRRYVSIYISMKDNKHKSVWQFKDCLLTEWHQEFFNYVKLLTI